MTLLLANKQQKVFGRRPTYEAIRVKLLDGAETTVHVVRYRRAQVRPRVVLFEKETYLLDWCQQHEVSSAMNGGFFLRSSSSPLGDMWIDGRRQHTEPFIQPWDAVRGSLYVTRKGHLSLAPRYLLPQAPGQDLLQAGPLLVSSGQSMIHEGEDTEGFSEGASQFDDDISKGRFPRTAIATNSEFIFSVACDGRTETEAGMSFKEFADALIRIGAEDALNLDGGSSSTIIYNNKLVNRPRGGEQDGYLLFDRGRPIYSGLVFERVD